MDVKVYVDGSYGQFDPKYNRDLKNECVFGAFLILDENDVPIFGRRIISYRREMVSMNNVGGELEATILGLFTALNAKNHKIDSVHVYYDYEGIYKWVSGEWKAKKPGSISYQQFVKRLLSESKISVSWTHVKGHSGNKWNDAVDSIAMDKRGCCYYEYRDVLKPDAILSEEIVYGSKNIK